MLLIKAAQIATAQRRIVRQVAQYKEGDLHIKNLGHFNYVPEYIKDYANNIAKISGEYSKNPFKKIKSWCKHFYEVIKNGLQDMKKPEQNPIDVPSEVVPNAATKSKKTKIDKKDAAVEVVPEQASKADSNIEEVK